MHRRYGHFGPTEGEIVAALQSELRPPVFVPSPEQVAADKKRQAQARLERADALRAIEDPVERLVRTAASCIYLGEQEMDRGRGSVVQVRVGELSDRELINEILPGALDGEVLADRGPTPPWKVARWFAGQATAAQVQTMELDFIPWVRPWPWSRRAPQGGVATEGWFLSHAYWPAGPESVHVGTDGCIYYARQMTPPADAGFNYIGLVRMAQGLAYETHISRRP